MKRHFVNINLYLHFSKLLSGVPTKINKVTVQYLVMPGILMVALLPLYLCRKYRLNFKGGHVILKYLVFMM